MSHIPVYLTQREGHNLSMVCSGCDTLLHHVVFDLYMHFAPEDGELFLNPEVAQRLRNCPNAGKRYRFPKLECPEEPAANT
jgi:hypothetical protein